MSTEKTLSNISNTLTSFQETVVNSSSSNIAIKAPIREGKTEAAILKSIHTDDKILFLVRTHEQAKQVATRYDSYGINVAHVGGAGWNNFHYPLDKSIMSFTPRDLFEAVTEFCDKSTWDTTLRGYVDFIEQLLYHNHIKVVVTVPEVAVHFNPKYFDTLIIDEESTIDWFRTHDFVIYEFQRHFGGFSEDTPLKRSIATLYEYLGDDENYNNNLKRYIKWGNDYLNIISKINDYKEEFKQNGSKHPEKDALQKVVNELNKIGSPRRRMNPTPINAQGNTQIIRLNEFIRKKSGDTNYYEAVKIVGDSFNFKMISYQQLQNGGKIWYHTNQDRWLLFKDWFKEFTSIYLILNKTSTIDTWFFDHLQVEHEVIKKETFRYEKSYLNTYTENDIKLAKELGNRGIVTAHIVGRKKDAYKLRRSLEKHQISCFVAEEHTKERIAQEIMIGNQVIIYLNSRIARGINMEMISVTMIHNYAFAVPGNVHPIETMRDELEQVIFRGSPTNPQDIAPRMIVWCPKKLRSRKERNFVTRYIRDMEVQDETNDTNIMDKYDVTPLFETSFLPLTNVNQLPVRITPERMRVDFPFIDLESNSGRYQKMDTDSDNSNSNIWLYQILHSQIRCPTTNMLYSDYITNVLKNRASTRILFSFEDFSRIIDNVKGKTLRRDDLYNLLHDLGFKDQVLYKKFINILEETGILTVEKDPQDRRYRLYIFASEYTPQPDNDDIKTETIQPDGGPYKHYNEPISDLNLEPFMVLQRIPQDEISGYQRYLSWLSVKDLNSIPEHVTPPESQPVKEEFTDEFWDEVLGDLQECLIY